MAAKGSAGRTDAHSDAVRESESSARAAGSVRRKDHAAVARRIVPRMPNGLRQAFRRDAFLTTKSQGEKRLYSVRRGVLVSSLDPEEGEPLVCALHVPGDFIPVAWLATERPLTVKAVTDAEVDVFAEANLKRFFRDDAESGFALFDSICDMAVRQREAYCILCRLSVEGRLANFLLALGDHLGAREGRCFRVALPMRRCEIANYLGLRSETLSRVFARWRAEGLIEPGELRQITFPDIGRLEAVSRDEG